MADFANYTPGEYAKEHIRITPATLADGRDFFYLDDDPEFEPEELVNARALLRRLHFLESQSKNPWAEAELEALVWILDDIGFLADR